MTSKARSGKTAVQLTGASLRDYYAGGIPAARFTARAAKLDLQQFSPEDVDRILDELSSLDPLLRKTAALANAAILHRGAVQPAVKDWLVAVVQSEFAGSWTADTTTRRVFDRYRAAINGETLESRRAFNALKLTLLLLYREDKIDPFELVAEIERLAGAGGRTPSRRGRPEVEPFVRVSDLNALKRVYGSLRLWLEEARAARTRVREAQDERDRIEEKLLRKRNELTRVAEQLGEVSESLRRAKAEITELTQALQTAENLRIHDRHETKGRMRRFMRERVVPRLRDSAEALKMSPPRIGPALERLDLVLEQIATEDVWLISD